jgi:hypothetical protein
VSVNRWPVAWVMAKSISYVFQNLPCLSLPRSACYEEVRSFPGSFPVSSEAGIQFAHTIYQTFKEIGTKPWR